MFSKKKRQLIEKIKIHYPALKLYIVRKKRKLTQSFFSWFNQFSQATRKKKLSMIKVPLGIALIAVLINSYGSFLLPPKVAVSFPSDNGKEILLDSKIELQFDREVNQQSLEKAFSIEPDVAGSFSWQGNTKVTFTPDNSLERTTQYSIKLKPWYRSKFFIPAIKQHQITFNTLGHPTVLLSSPSHEAPEERSSITVMFDRAMIPLTTADNKQEKQPAFTISPEISGQGRWLGTTTYQFRPDENYQPATTYTYTVAKGMASEDGGELQEENIFSFSTVKPRILTTSPKDFYQYANPKGLISATVSLPVDLESAQEKFTLYEIKKEEKIPVKTTVSVNKDKVSLKPTNTLKRGSEYKVEISEGLLSTEGPNGSDSDYSWSFKTAPLPAITKTDPKDGAKDIQNTRGIEVSFASPMDKDSFEGNIQISPPPEQKPSFYFSSHKQKNNLSINTYLGRSTNYTITISGNVKDQYGVPLGRDYRLNFTTAEANPNISILPARMGFASFNQQIIPRIVSKVINSSKVQYKLYELSQREVRELYKSNYEDSPYNIKSYNYKKLKLVKEWKETYTADKNTAVNVITKVESKDGDNINSGYYFLNTSIDGAQDNLVMIVSKAALTLKMSDSQALVWAVDQSTGKVIEGMDIELKGSTGETIASGKTNKDGVFIAEENFKSFNQYNKSILAFGSKDGDKTMVSARWSEGIHSSDFGINRYYNPQESDAYRAQEELKLHLQLDRPIYRPGQTVFYKGIVRYDDDGEYTLPDQKENVKVTVKDAKNNSILSTDVNLNDFGSFSGEFTLGEDVSVGNFIIEATIKQNGFKQTFQVEEYAKPDFKVDVTSDKTDYVDGQRVAVSVDASYFFGASVPFSEVEWTVTTQDSPFRWQRDNSFTFGDNDGYWYIPWWSFNSRSQFHGKKIAEGTGTTDAKGNYQVFLPTNIGDETTNQRLRLEATVKDETNRVIAASKEFVIHQSNMHIGVKPVSYSSQVGKATSVDLVAVDVDGNELSDTPLTVSFYKRTWNSIREKNPDDGRFYWTHKSNDTLITSVDTTTDSSGRTKATFTPDKGGTYRAVVTGTDSNGRGTKSATSIWVSGNTDDRGVRRNNHDRIILVPDKQEYQLSDTASIYAGLPFSDFTGLITVERGSVIDYQVVKTNSEKQSFSIPINNKYSPNAFVSAVFVSPGNEVKRPPEFKQGLAEIKTNDPSTKIDVKLKTNKEKYEPGETISGEVFTVDGNGNPVEGEVALALVDESVWTLARAKLADIYQTFYRPRSLEVLTSHILTKSMDRINTNVNLGSKGGSGGCFTKDTPILMANGTTKPIASIATGDKVLTRESEDSSKLVEATVERLFIHDVDGYLLINNTLEVTNVHRVYTKRGWRTAGELTKKDSLLSPENKWVKIKSITPIEKPVRVYNIEIGKYHTYIAGDFWVHNQKGEDGPLTLRENFQDTAYWDAHATTDSYGKANFSIDLPDNLTTWRLMGVAITKDTAAGQSTKNVLVTKDVLVRPLLPRFVSTGDMPSLGMQVHNQTDTDQTMTVNIAGEGFIIQENTSKEVTLNPRSSQAVYWQTEITASQDEDVTVEMTARDTSGNSDAVRKTLSTNSYFTPEVVATSGEAADTAKENIHLPTNIVPNLGGLKIGVSPSLGAGVEDASSYLLSYQYWCSEQTTNRIIPGVHLLQLAQELEKDTINGRPTKDLKQLVEHSIQKMVNEQHVDGGWGWWMNNPSDYFISSLVLDGLLTAQENGFSVPDKTISDGTEYLLDKLNAGMSTLEIQSYSAAVLARMNKVNTPAFSRLMDRRWQMQPIGRVYLLKALQESNKLGKDRKRLLGEMLSLADRTNTTAHWEPGDKKQWQLMNSPTTLTALMLEVLVVENPKHPLVPETTRWLMQTQEDGHWSTTRETAVAVQAITKVMTSRKEGKTKENWLINISGNRTAEGEFTKKDLLKKTNTFVDLKDIQKATDVPVEIQKSGSGSLYYFMNLKYFLPFEEVEPLEQGIVLIRELIDTKGNIIDSNKVSTNDELFVRLTLAVPAERHHIIIEDTLPAGIEAVNESLATTALLNVEKTKPSEDKKRLYFKHQEIRDDRVVLFAERVPAGIYEYTYRARPTTPGRYHHPPAQAFNMYLPDISGHSAGGWLEVE